VNSEKPTSSTTDGGAQRGGWTRIVSNEQKNNSFWFYRYARNIEKPNFFNHGWTRMDSDGLGWTRMDSDKDVDFQTRRKNCLSIYQPRLFFQGGEMLFQFRQRKRLVNTFG
jgi:hypothetical protein